MKLTSLSIPHSHTPTPTAAALDRTQHAIYVSGPAPFLMRQDVDAEGFLARLDEVHVGEHTVCLKRSGKLGGEGGVGVEAREGDELEDEAKKNGGS